ncbi:MAG: DUF3237 domain-containing protein [Proteobacteria bacterium]|jgi:hypothetical protein|nr:DUF3237 domain-containing protein [Pseudomonadota bacterium]
MKTVITLPTPQLTFFAQLQISLGEPIEMGIGRRSLRRIIPIIGGHFRGPKVEGTILNLGADWQTIGNDRLSELDTRYALRTKDGATIEVINKGFRHGPEAIIDRLAAGEDVNPSEYSMITQAILETGHKKHNWVNKLSFIGTGARFKSEVILDLYYVS